MSTLENMTYEKHCFETRVASEVKGRYRKKDKAETYETDILTYAVDDTVVAPACATIGEH